MGLYDATTGEYSDAAFGLDTQGALDNQPSLLDSAIGVVTKALPLTALSIVNTFANTAMKMSSMLPSGVVTDTAASLAGIDTSNPNMFNVSDELSGIGATSYQEYYDAHSQGIETAGFLIGSFIPGTAGIKALKLAQAGYAGEAVARATGIFQGIKAKAIADGLAQINAGPDALFASLSTYKYKAIAAGFGDQALQSLAFETAVAGTMNASPIMSQQDMGDIATNMFYGTLLGGALGGGIESIFTRAAFKRAEVVADIGTKAAELTERLGFAERGATFRGTSVAGDAVVQLVHSIDQIPTDLASQLALKKAMDTTNRAFLDSRNLLTTLAGKGNEDLSTGLMDSLLAARAAGASKEGLYEKLAGLAKITRLGDDTTVPTEDTFYVNKFAGATRTALGTTFSDLISTTPNASADISLRFGLRPYTTAPIIAKATDTFTATDGSVVPLYTKVQDAWDASADMYIDSKLQIHVNPDAPNIMRIPRPGEERILSPTEERVYRATGNLPEGSKPLLGTPTADPVILNTIDHSFSSSAIPIVGDYGPVKLIPRGLSYGGEISIQTPTSVLTDTTSTIDANARYLWASRRGIKAGDTIDPTDIPMMEQLYRQATTSGVDFTSFMDGLRRRGVTMSEGSDLPYSANELLERIQGSKDDLIHDLIQANPKMSHEEIAVRANVPSSYIENSLQAKSPSDYMVDPEQWSRANHVRLLYDIGNTKTPDGQILKGYLQSQYRMKTIQDAAYAALARERGDDWQNLTINGLSSKDATIEGTGAKFLTFSNSEYGSIGQQVERIGRFLTDWIQQRIAGYSSTLAPSANALRNDLTASAEAGAFLNIRRKTGEQFTFLPTDLAAKYWRTPDTVVLRNSLIRDKTGAVVDWNMNYTPSGFLPGAALVDNAVRVPDQALHTFYDLSPKVAAWERANMEINDARIVSRNNWRAAMGLTPNQQVGTLYAPPIDTAKYPFFALVRARPGQAFTDDSVAMITSNSAEGLKAKIDSLRPDYDVYTKDMITDYHTALGDYQYNRNFADNRVQSDLTRRGILNDVYPDTRAETIIAQYISHHTAQETRLLRDYVELGNAQPFAEIRAMGARFTGAETSQTGYINKALGRSSSNPYESYIKTALAIGSRDEYRLWNDAQEKVESFASTAFNTAVSAIRSVDAGILPLEQAAPIMERMGLGNGYGAASNILSTYRNIANQLPDTKVLSRVVNAGNLFQSATAVRLDAWQSLINIISAPILTAAEGSSVLGKLASGSIRTELPDGSGRQVLSTTKAIFGAISDFWDSDIRNQWIPTFMKMNITRPNVNEYFQAVKDLTIPKSGSAVEAVQNGLSKAVETGAKLTLSQWSENAIRTIAAFTAKRIFEDAGYTGTDLLDQIGTFVNRTHGNYIASQRPVAFQGPIGQAMSLFQTYQFNFYQQMFRYVENGEAKTLAIMAALQTGLFGMQSLPGYQMINQHLVGNAAGNPSHADLYSTTTNFFDKKLGDWLLYGAASNILSTGLYSRGDINPRQISILPINPLDYPAISGAINFLSNLWKTTDNIVQGGKITDALMQGMEHNGLSRPLAGLGQLMQGYVSTSKGDLVTATRPNMGDGSSGWNDVISAANFSRLAGARPLDEAINMDMLYRKTLYQAKDETRMNRLGETVKEQLTGNTPIDPNKLGGFIHSYAEAGGEIANFGKKMLEWTQEANVAKANMIFRHLQQPMAKQDMIEMGGQPLPDFQNRGNTAVSAIPTSPNTTTSQTPSQTPSQYPVQ